MIRTPKWTFKQRVKNTLIVRIVLFFLACLRFFPPWTSHWLGRLLGLFAYVVAPAARRQALGNIALVFPVWSPHNRRRLVRRSYRELGTYFGETLALLSHPTAFSPVPLSYEARMPLERAYREGKGVVLASAHLGPWEHVAGTLVYHGFPLTVLGRGSYDTRFDFIYVHLRRGMKVKSILRGARGAEFRIIKTLRRGEILGIPMDLNARVPSIDVPFLGRSARTAVGPARIALRTGAPVVVATVAPAPDQSLQITTTRIPTEDLAPGVLGEHALTSRINDELSSRIRALPSAWIWMHPRFE